MILRARADSLELDAGENGWSLIAETDEGDTIVLNIQSVAFDFAGSDPLKELLMWRDEGQRAMVDLGADQARSSATWTNQEGLRGDA